MENLFKIESVKDYIVNTFDGRILSKKIEEHAGK